MTNRRFTVQQLEEVPTTHDHEVVGKRRKFREIEAKRSPLFREIP
jgi:hypothetical protein